MGVNHELPARIHARDLETGAAEQNPQPAPPPPAAARDLELAADPQPAPPPPAAARDLGLAADPQPAPPPPAASRDHEMGAAEQNPQPACRVVPPQQNVGLTDIILAFCFQSAINIAIQSVQTHSKLPLTFHLLSLATSFTFSSLFVAKFMAPDYPETAQVLNQMGVFFAATAFFLAVTIPFPMSLNCITWTLYAVSLLAVILCKRNYYAITISYIYEMLA